MSQQINLFNPVFLKQKKIFTTFAMAQALAVLVAGVAVLAAYGQRSVAELTAQSSQSSRQFERSQARQRAAALQMAPRQGDKALEAQVAQLELQKKALREAGDVLQGGAFGNTGGYSAYFRALARQDAPGVWLTAVGIDRAGAGISIEGRALDATLVPAYLARLSAEQVFEGKRFGSLEITTPVADTAGPPTVAPRAQLRFVEFRLQSIGGGG